VGIFLKGVQTLVIPAGINLLRAAFAKRDMDVDRRGLSDAVESPDALLEEFGIRGQIESLGWLISSKASRNKRSFSSPPRPRSRSG